LLVLDNLREPAVLALAILPDCVPEDLQCRLLFTTRRHDLGRFAGIEVTVLPENAALRLLLRHPSRRAALEPSHPDHEHALAITRMLGRLPLALELAGAYLGKFSGEVTLEGYREGLKGDGALSTLDADAAELTEADLRRIHDLAVAATIGEQWEALGDESARLLLRVACLFQESATVPIARLGLLAGLADEARPGRLSPLLRAAKRLADACLVERLEGDQLWLHPLIREFTIGQMSPHDTEEFRRQSLERAASAFEHFPTLEALDVRRGVDALQEDLIAVLELCRPPAAELGTRVQALVRLLQREAHHLRSGVPKSPRTRFAQQVRNRAFLLGIDALQSSAEDRLTMLGQPHFRLLWVASRESPSLVRTLAAHERRVNAVATTPDGRRAISGADDGTLILWDLATGQRRYTVVAHASRVLAVSTIPGASQAISCSADGTLRLSELESGHAIRVMREPGRPVYSVVVTPDGRMALSASDKGTLKLWDIADGQLLRTFAGNEQIVRALAVAPNGRQVLSGSDDGMLRLWDLETGRPALAITGPKVSVNSVAITPDGRHAVSASRDRTLRLWDLATGQLVRSFTGHEDGVAAVAVTPNGRQVLSASHDRTLRLWDIATGRLIHTFAGHEGVVSAVVVAPDSRHVVSASHDRTVRLWDLSTVQPGFAVTGHEGRVNAVATTCDGRYAISGSEDRTLKLWDLATGQPALTISGHRAPVSAVAITRDGRRALSGCDDGTLKLWNLRTGGLVRAIPGHHWVNALGITPDGPRATPDSRRSARGPSGPAMAVPPLTFPGLGGWARVAVALTPCGHYAVSGWRDGTLKLWNLANGQPDLTYIGHKAPVSAVVVTPNGRYIVSGSSDRTLKLWDLAAGSMRRSFTGHEAAVTALALVPYRHLALSGSQDGTLKIWDLATGKLFLTLSGHHSGVTALAVTPNGLHALSISEDRTLRLWDLEKRTCCAIAPLESAPLAIALAPDGKTVVIGDGVGNVHCFQIHVVD
jgi:WD40 repeat protein